MNGKRITARYIPGRRFRLSVKTFFGPIEGEIIIAAKSDLVEKAGIECRVKQVLIRREFFDLEKSHTYGLSRLCGEVNADFLPITADRNDFIRDSQEFRVFYQVVRSELEKILKELKKESEVKYLKKIKEELKEVLSKIRQALMLHPELVPSGRAMAKRMKRKGDLAASALAEPKLAKEKETLPASSSETKTNEQKPEKPKVVLPKPEIIKRIKLKKLGVSVALSPLGDDGPEAISLGNLIYINSDHPLYQKLSAKKEQFELHLLRLITQEIVIMKKLRIGAKEAFEWQGKLLTDALCEKSARLKKENKR